MHTGQPVLIYTDRVLPGSCTFIREQAEALTRFVPYYAGSQAVEGLSLDPVRKIVVNPGTVPGKVREVIYKATFQAPSFHRAIARKRPALIHAHFGPDGYDALHIAEMLDVPLITTLHGYEVTTKREHALKANYRFRRYIRNRATLQANGTRFIAVSNFIRDRMLEQGFPAEKIMVHYIGVDVERFQPDPDAERGMSILFVARFVPKKGGEHLIRAMQRVQAQNPAIELLMVGDGPLRSQWESLAAETLQRYRFLGWQSPEDVKVLMQTARVFCVPSIVEERGDAEAFGIVFAEAQACGLPVVSFASGGIPEAVAHGETGWLASEGNVDMLAGYILQLCADDGLWRRFSASGVRRIREQFNLATQTAELERIYQALL